MSYKDFVNINVKLDKQQFSLNEPIIGEVLIQNKSQIQLDLESIQLKLILKHQGKGETDIIELDSHVNRDYKILSRNETVTIKFNFKPVNYVTYNGYNVAQTVLIHTKVDIKKESEKLLRNEKLSDFKIGGYLSGVFMPDFYNETPITVIRGETDYQITHAKGNVKPGLRSSLIALGVGLILCTILGVIAYNKFSSKEFLYGIIGCYLLLILLVYYLKLGPYLSIGRIDFDLKNLEGNLYEVNLVLEKRTSIIKEISYQLIGKELVTYDNGSSRSTATHTFYKSPINTIKGRMKKLIDESGLPTKSLPTSINNNDFEIRWIFKLKVLTKANLKLNGTAKIEIAYEKDYQ